MRNIGLLFLFACTALLRPALAAVDAPDLSVLEQEQKIEQMAEEKIRGDILEPILGREKANVFVDVVLEVVAQQKRQTETRAGASEEYKEAGGPGAPPSANDFVLPGIPKQKNLGGQDQQQAKRPEMAQQRGAQQERGVAETTYSVRRVVKSFKVTIIHDENVAKDKLELVRGAIVDAMGEFELKPESVIFKPTQFTQLPAWHEFKQPGVFVPLIFAALLAMLLLFLFGPVTLYMGRYVRFLQEKTGPEVSVDSKFENAPGQQPGGLGGGGGQGAVEGSFEHWSKKAEEEEAERMKRFEPFKYINEENLKRLAYLVRREEPWVIAVVLTYLHTEFARAVLSGLPRELQSRVALEMATIRQVSREQIVAIDAEIKEKVDFVLGGIEHLCHMLEDADENSRQNILEYLQNERPALFEKVREQIVMFEDIVGFPDSEMQSIVRELKTESMARALQGCSPELLHKFLSNMSTGAASMLKEAMEYEKELNEQQVQDERKKVMDVVKRLENEGRIVIREKKSGTSLEGLEEEVSTSEARKSKWGTKPQPVQQGLQGQMGYPMGMGFPMVGAPMGYPGAMPMAPMTAVPVPTPVAVTPAPAAPSVEEAQKPASKAAPKVSDSQRYLDAGMGCYNEGKYDDAIAYLEHAIGLDAALWQAHQYAALSYWALDRGGEASEHLDKLLELNPAPEIREWVENLKAAA